MLMPLSEPRNNRPSSNGSAAAVDHAPAGLATPDDQSAPDGVSSATESSRKIPAFARVLPSLTDVAFLMPISFLFLKLSGARSLLGDGDTGWHVRTGEWILQHHQVPQVDFFSFTRPGAPWFAWEWLWDVIFALFYRAGGLQAVVFASTLVICLTSVALFRLIRRKCNNGLVSIAVTLLATGGCAIHWLARPHLFTLLFFTLTLHITDRAFTEGRTKLLAWLVPLTLLWTNLHAGFFVIFLILACYVGSNLLNALIDRDPSARIGYLKATAPWLATALGCFAVSFINPYGWHLHQHMLEYITDPYQLQHITEFQSMNFHDPVTVYFEPLMIGSLMAVAWAVSRRQFADMFLVMGWMHLALIAQRNLPLFSIACAPLVAQAIVALLAAAKASPLSERIGQLSGWFLNTSAGTDLNDRFGRVHLISAAGYALLGLLLFSRLPLNDKFISTYDPNSYPEKALPLLRAAETHHIFAEDEWGDYLIYQLYPSKQVFIDGRSDFYGDDFGLEYIRLLTVQVGWEKTLDRFNIDTVVLSPKFALSQTLKISRDWRLVYDDHITLVFRRAVPDTSSVASRGDGDGRDLAITKTVARDLTIAKPKT